MWMAITGRASAAPRTRDNQVNYGYAASGSVGGWSTSIGRASGGSPAIALTRAVAAKADQEAGMAAGKSGGAATQKAAAVKSQTPAQKTLATDINMEETARRFVEFRRPGRGFLPLLSISRSDPLLGVPEDGQYYGVVGG